MEGLFIRKKDEFLHQSKHSSVILSLLAKAEGIEIMLQEILPDRPCGITPGDSDHLFEFIYIFEGSLIVTLGPEEVVLKPGDYFYVNQLKENVPMVTKTGAKLLYISSQPVFEYIDNYNDELSKLLKQVESKDSYTYNHGSRVQTYAVKISNQLHLSKDIIHTLAVSSLFHDLGKVDIPNSVLNKPGRLTSEEFDIIKTHPTQSGKLLEGKFLDRIAKIVEQHHERLDGSGYPLGLKGDEILLEAKIIAVADSYDAMTSDRAYRNGMEPRAAIEELKQMAGTSYDVEIVNALEQVINEEGLLLDVGPCR